MPLILPTISLLQGTAVSLGVEHVFDVLFEAGAYDLRACKMEAGVTLGVWFNGFSLEVRDDVEMSIALRNASNRFLTSPVMAAIFFVKSVKAGNGNSAFIPTSF